ncbi:probable methyltransferase-like protein 24 isoform X2 [Mercenaria mercenaria]|uniref:probable methyltransferase-like protein 24 isoform X2 n=1 Tax=Mercenaria mercenaria TaxID=6596 RepID=UPI00234EB6DB|nr:probable methyltransferase-like protein 24 isoform X2 [Mercenaria mercenaria]
MSRESKCNFRYVYMFGLFSVVFIVFALFTFGYMPGNMLLMTDQYEAKPEVVRVNATFCNPSEHDELSDINVIDKMDTEALYLTFSRYILTKQIKCCNVSRAGPGNTFGKNICLDYFNKMQNRCLVYSFGSQFKFDFENAISKSYRCEIHTFDPSLSTEGVHIPSGVNFHLIGLSNTDTIFSAPVGFRGEKKWRMQSLLSIRKSLKHTKRFIDVLKIDIEGWEWKALPEILQSGVLNYVKQLCLEVHFGYDIQIIWNGNRAVGYRHLNTTWGNVAIQNQLQTLKRLYDHGFRIFMSDPIKQWATYHLKQTKKSIDTLVEISLVNIYNQ